MAEIVYRENQEERLITLDKDSFVIGRSPSCEIAISSDTISRRHAKLEKRSNRYYITDLGSRNGVFVNDEKIVESVLKDGDFIKLGVFEFTFHDKEPVIVDSNKTIQQEQKTIMLENPLEKFILKDLPASEDTYIEKKEKDKVIEDDIIAEDRQESTPDDDESEIESDGYFPNLLIFHDEKAFRATIKKNRNTIGGSAISDIPINHEGFPESACIIRNEKGIFYLVDEFQTGEIMYNNVPVIHKRLFDKMIFMIQDVTFQFISNKKGAEAVFEKVYAVFRIFIEKPLIGMAFVAGILILISLLLVIFLL